MVPVPVRFTRSSFDRSASGCHISPDSASARMRADSYCLIVVSAPAENMES